MVKINRIVMLGLAVVLVGAVVCAGFMHRVKVTQTRSALGTKVTITMLAKNKTRALALIDQGFAEIERLENIYSDRRPTAELARLNQRAAGEWFSVSEDMADAIEDAIYWNEKSGGLFDITVGVLGELWGFKSNQQQVPDPRQIKAALGQVGMEQLVWDRKAHCIHFRQPHMRLDLGGIAKLLILQKLGEYYKRKKVYQYLINLGGDVLAGQRGAVKKWLVGISDPKDPDTVLFQLEVEDALILTSGDYFRSFSQGSSRYHHIFDPRTGRPLKTVNAATVVIPSIQPEPLPSIVVFLLGEKAGLDMVEDIPLTEAVVMHDGKLSYSSGFLEKTLQ